MRCGTCGSEIGTGGHTCQRLKAYTFPPLAPAQPPAITVDGVVGSLMARVRELEAELAATKTANTQLILMVAAVQAIERICNQNHDAAYDLRNDVMHEVRAAMEMLKRVGNENAEVGQ